MNTWNKKPSKDIIENAMKNLQANGINTKLVSPGTAKDEVLSLIPNKSEVMDMTSVTLQELGISDAIASGEFDAVKQKLYKMDRNTQSGEMQKLGSAPAWAVGSVHAITHNGQILIASKTGSQIPAYAYGAQHVIFVVGVQKIVKTLEDGLARINEYVLPLENDRAMKAYGIQSGVDKILIINKEIVANRITVVFVDDVIGF